MPLLRPSWSPTRTLLDIQRHQRPRSCRQRHGVLLHQCRRHFCLTQYEIGRPNPAAFIWFPRRAEKALRSIPKATSMEFPITEETLSPLSRWAGAARRRARGHRRDCGNATVFDSAASCTPAPTLAVSVTEFGAPTTEFTAAAGPLARPLSAQGVVCSVPDRSLPPHSRRFLSPPTSRPPRSANATRP